MATGGKVYSFAPSQIDQSLLLHRPGQRPPYTLKPRPRLPLPLQQSPIHLSLIDPSGLPTVLRLPKEPGVSGVCAPLRAA
jgi:hypothetical protein